MMAVLLLLAAAGFFLVNAGLVNPNFMRVVYPFVAVGLLLPLLSREFYNRRDLAATLKRRRVLIIVAVGLAAVGLNSGYSFSPVGRRVPVLVYHRVGKAPHQDYPVPTISPAEFEREIAYLDAQGYRTITPDQLLDALEGRPAHLPRKPVLITFDDGWRDNYLNAFPILKRHHMSGTVFLVADGVNHTQRLSIPQIKEMSAAGWVFGAHTVSHPHLTELKAGSAQWEITQAKERLEEMLGTPVLYFCYPYGDGASNPSIRKIVAEAGYRAAFSTRFGLSGEQEDRLALKRVLISDTPWLAWLELRFVL